MRRTLIDARSLAWIGRLKNILTGKAGDLRIEAQADRALPLQRLGVGEAISRGNTSVPPLPTAVMVC